MTKIPIEDVDDVLFNPTRYFTLPSEVFDCTDLDIDQKIALLLNWEWEIKQQEVAEEENMKGHFVDLLPDIKSTLRKLGISNDISHTSMTNKFGGA